MIYEELERDDPLSQGDIIDDYTLLVWEVASDMPVSKPESATANVRIVVLTQACDLAQTKATRVQVAVVHRAQHLVDVGILKANVIRDQIRRNRVCGWYFLPSGSVLDESIVDLRDLHTLPRVLLEQLVTGGKRICRIRTPYREHLAQHFSNTYARIALPDPYETEADN